MRNWNAQQLAGRNALRKGTLAVDRLNEDMFAAKLQRPVPNQRAGKQSRLAQDLEPVANAEHGASLRREVLDRLHDRAEARNRPGAQVIAVAEAARDDHRIGIAEGSFLVPNEPGRMAHDVAKGVDGVLVTIRGG